MTEADGGSGHPGAVRPARGSRAGRCTWDGQDGTAWTELTAVFEKENVACTLHTAAPGSAKAAAAMDLADLLLAYAGTHSTPDLNLSMP